MTEPGNCAVLTIETRYGLCLHSRQRFCMLTQSFRSWHRRAHEQDSFSPPISILQLRTPCPHETRQDKHQIIGLGHRAASFSKLDGLEPFQAGFCRRPSGVIASEISVGTVSSDYYSVPLLPFRKAESSSFQSKQWQMNPSTECRVSQQLSKLGSMEPFQGRFCRCPSGVIASACLVTCFLSTRCAHHLRAGKLINR